MRRPLLLRHLALAGAAFSLLVAGSAASATLFADRVAPNSSPSQSTSTQGSLSGHGAASAISSDQQTYKQGGQPAAGDSARAGEPGTTIQAAGPSIFEQQARAQQLGQQISAGPTTFEQQDRSLVPRPKTVPGPITRRPGPVL